MITAAWAEVTIQNCWKHVGILPGSWDVTSEENGAIITEIDQLTGQLGIADRIEAKQYVSIDDEIAAEEEMDDKTIIRIVTAQNCESDADSDSDSSPAPPVGL